jgi:hypothetical protein
MTTVATKPNAATISRILSNAHFIKSTEATTRIRGYHLTSEGFRVVSGSSSVLVYYEFGDWAHKNWDAIADRRADAFARMIVLLTNKGFDVTHSALQPSVLQIKKAVA